MRIIQLVTKKAANSPIISSRDQGTLKLPKSGVAEIAKTNRNININQTIELYLLNDLDHNFAF
jgi:hypothetical protein